MRSFVRLFIVLLAMGITVSGQAQSNEATPVAKSAKHKVKKPTLEEQIQAMKADLQAQIAADNARYTKGPGLDNARGYMGAFKSGVQPHRS